MLGPNAQREPFYLRESLPHFFRDVRNLRVEDVEVLERDFLQECRTLHGLLQRKPSRLEDYSQAVCILSVVVRPKMLQATTKSIQ